MKLWIYGDSFAMDHQDDSQWHHRLQSHYECDLSITAYSGYPNEKIISSMAHNLSNIAVNDWIIIITTDEMRRWFFPDYPEYSNYYNLKKEQLDLVHKDADKALELYSRVLLNPESDKFNFVCQTYYLNQITAGRNVIHINAFKNSAQATQVGSTRVHGTLTESLSLPEFLNDTQRKYMYMSGDTRFNHISHNNHIHFANKLRSIIDQETNELDLTKGFELKFLSI